MTEALVPYEGGGAVEAFGAKQQTLLRKTLAKDTTPDQFEMFLEVCARTGLNPFAKQIYAVVRKGRNGVPTMTIQVGIDGLRLIAQRTGEYEGQTEPQWCGMDGIWRDVWLEDDPPAAARVGVRRRGFIDPVYGIAKYSSYVQMVDEWSGYGESAKRTGKKPNEMWAKMPDNQLAKCAEALAFRKAFPQELSELHTEVESRAGEYIEMSREQEEPRRIKPPKSKSQAALAAPAPVDEETGEIEDDEAIEGEVVEAPEPAPERPKTFAEKNGPPFGEESEEPAPTKRATKPKPAPPEAADDAPPAGTWAAFYNEITPLMQTLGRNFADLGMVLNCPGNVMGVKEWFAANEKKIPDRYTFAHKALLRLEEAQ